MLAEPWMVLSEPRHRLANRAGDTGPGTLGRGRSTPSTTTEAEGAGELLHEEVAFGVRLRGSLDVPDRARFGDVLVDLVETPPVGLLGLCVEKLAGVADVVTGRSSAQRSDGVSRPVSATTRSSTWCSCPGSASSRAR